MSRRWMLVMIPVLWLAVLVSAIAVVRARHQARTMFMQLESLSAERDRLNIEWNQLQLEQSAWSNHGYVERVARVKGRMTFPTPGKVEIIAP